MESQIFKQEMESAGVNYPFINYEGAKHSFTNPDGDVHGQRFGLPLGYSAEADLGCMDGDGRLCLERITE